MLFVSPIFVARHGPHGLVQRLSCPAALACAAAASFAAAASEFRRLCCRFRHITLVPLWMLPQASPPFLPLQQFYSSASLAADFAVTAAAGELAITFRIIFAFFSFEGEEEVVKKEVVWCSYRFDDLNFDLTIATVSSGDEAVPATLPTIPRCCCCLLCPALLCYSCRRNAASCVLPFGLPPNTVLFFRQRKEQEVKRLHEKNQRCTMRCLHCYRAFVGWQPPNAVSQRKAQAVCRGNPCLLQHYKQR